MEVKTYSRARSAVAAAKKALGHLDAFISRWDGVEYTRSPEGKFTCEVTIRSGGGKEIADAVSAAGFIPNVTMIEDYGQDLEREQPIEPRTVSDDELEDDDIEDEAGEQSEVEELIEEAGGDPLPAPTKKGYINENSNIVGACEMARSIAIAMPDAPRKDVIAACRQAGIAYGTARTQLQRVRGGK